MFSRIARTVASFAAVVVVYWMYALIAVPFVEPTVRTVDRIEPTAEEIQQAAKSGQRNLQSFAKYFKKGDWELEGSPKVLESPQAKLLIKEYHNLPDGRVKLYPCTLIFFPGAGRKPAGEDEQAIVMKAPEGAILQFDEAFDLRKAKVGKLIGGQLVGKITIQSAPTRPNSPDDLFIATRDVELVEDRIWTPHPVEFRMGQNTGSGREMRINLVKTDDGGGSKKSGAQFGEIDSFELVRDVKLHLHVDADTTRGKGGLFGPRDEGKKRSTSAADQSAEPPVEVTCQGPFKFDVPRSLATFSDQVDVLRINTNGESDQMNCETLAIQFGPREHPAKPLAETTSPIDETAAAAAREKQPRKNAFDLELRRIEAIGDPVVIRAPSQGGHARCQRLQYEIKTGRIVLEGNQDVTLHQGSNEIRTRRFDYRPGETGGLGWLLATGPGWLQGAVEKNPSQKYQAQWNTELRMQPKEQTQLVSIVGAAQVRYSEMGVLAADEIHVWLLERKGPVRNAQRPGQVVVANYAPGSIQAAEPPPQTTTPPTLTPKNEITPQRVLAQGNVTIDGPRVTGATRRMEVWFQHPEIDAAVAASSYTTPAGAPAKRGGGMLGGRTPTQSFDVRGDLLRLQLSMEQGVTHIADVSIEGGARLAETTRTKPDEKPLLLQGDRLHVAQADSDDAHVEVAGKPATVEARGLTLVGGAIQLDRATNRLWIDGPGRMKLPMDRDLNGQALGQRQTMDIDWQGGMQFDGKNAIFDRAVTARGEHQSLKAESLEVALRKKIDFANPQLPAEKRDPPAAREPGQSAAGSEIEQVVCRGGITIQNRTFDEQGQLSIDLMQMRDISINQVTGAIDGRGPGAITTVHRGAPSSNLASPSPLGPGVLGGATRTSNTTSSTAADKKYSFLNVRFEKTITGSVHRQELTFADQVRTVYGPVADWQSQLDPDTPDELGPQAVLLNCDQLTVRQMPAATKGARATAELEATGNTLIEGQTFTARAHKLSFAEAKDLLVLEGNGGSDAQLFRQARAGGPTSQAAARRIMYWRNTNRVEVDDARFLDLGNLGGGGGDKLQENRSGFSNILGNGTRGPSGPRTSQAPRGNGTARPSVGK